MQSIPHDPETGEVIEHGNGELPLGVPRHIPGETPARAFDRLCEARMNKALKHISLIGNLANRSNYAYADDDVELMLSTLRRAIDDISSRFRVNSPRAEFKLSRR